MLDMITKDYTLKVTFNRGTQRFIPVDSCPDGLSPLKTDSDLVIENI